MAAATEIAPELGIGPACEVLGLGRATFYRRRHPRPDARMVSRPQPPPLPKTRVVGHGPQSGLVLDITKLLGPVKWTYFYL
jgi:hypothetical protein